MQERQVQASRSPTRCPWCHDDLSATKELVACAPCGARHHQACYDEHGACASCGATEALRRPVPSARPAHARPPVGSKIDVSVDGERTTYGWTSKSWSNLLLCLLMMVVPPLGVWYLYRVLREAQGSLVLTPDAVMFTAQTKGGLSSVRKRIPREEVGAVRVQNTAGAYYLSIDHGVTRHVVMTGVVAAALSAPEFEWLAERLNAWKG